MSMFDYYVSILKLAIFVFCGLTVTSAFCAVGWFLSDRELKKERFCNSMLHNKVKVQNSEIESLKAKNYFLLNRISEVKENGGKN